MHFQFVVAPPTPTIAPAPTPTPPDTTAELLRELLEVQREQTDVLRVALESRQESGPRRSVLTERHPDTFSHLPENCRRVLPALEQAFLRLLDQLTEELIDPETQTLEGDFQLSDFLDRYAIRLSQLGAIINVLGPIADTTHAEE